MKNLLVPFFLLLAVYGFPHSTGPMFTHGIASTGAPHETTCGSCHGGGSLNGDILFTDLSGRNLFQDGYYSPGQQYFISAFIISSAPFPEGGLQFRAVDTTGAPAGWFLPGNTSNSSIAPVRLQYRRGYWNQYIENPTPITPNYANGAWRIQIISAWTAPTFSSHPITFYASGITANNNDSVTGDNAYAIQYTVYKEQPLHQEPQVPPAIANRIVTDLAILLPVEIADGHLYFSAYSHGGEKVRYRIYNTVGVRIKEGEKLVPDGESKLKISLTNVSDGIYYVKFITSRGGVMTHRVVLTR